MTENEDDRPWEQPGAIRRDWERHRFGLLHALVVPCGMGLGPMSMLALGVCGGGPVELTGAVLFVGCLGLSLSGITYAMARRDLKKMRANLMDPKGRPGTKDAMVVATVCAVLSAQCCT